MSLLSWFDLRTLYACQCMLSVMFAVVFFGVQRVVPTVRGVRSMALAFVLGIPSTFLMMFRGQLPALYSVWVADVLAAVCFLLLYDGVVRFVGAKPKTRVLAGVAAVALCVVGYASLVQPSVVMLVAAMGLLAATIRAFTAWALLKRAGWRGTARRGGWRGVAAGSAECMDGVVNHSAMRFFGALLVILSGLGVVRVGLTVYLSALGNFMERNSAPTSVLLLNVAFIGVYGLSFLTMAGHELILQSQEESERDPVSGTLNRRGIEARLATELKRSSRSMMKMSVALVDIDHFKKVNDAHGHGAGDRVIREVARAVAGSLRDADYLGRYGGDEFLVVLPMTACHQGEIAIARFRRAVAALELGDISSLTLSVGITEVSPEDDAISVIARADGALYRAKSDGRDCTRAAVPESTYPVIPMGQGGRVHARH